MYIGAVCFVRRAINYLLAVRYFMTSGGKELDEVSDVVFRAGLLFRRSLFTALGIGWGLLPGASSALTTSSGKGCMLLVVC